jgi:predicted ester cyclase
VCTEWRFSGTHDGVFLGVAASGRRVDSLGATVTEVDDDGKSVSETQYWDAARFLSQVGAMPAAPAAGASS